MSVTSLPSAPFTFTDPGAAFPDDPAAPEDEAEVAEPEECAPEDGADEPAVVVVVGAVADDVTATSSLVPLLPHPAAASDTAARAATTPTIRRSANFLMGSFRSSCESFERPCANRPWTRP
ncbi:hypothetical protein [Tsukamurella columbiensis]|uniref:hypothetical protein n=1 Tax=Tsukamurella TaxID=2060 RepID=UPI003977827A